ncbi:MAG: lipopolysaccharide biosynthesis protein [Thiohalorhabdus sp.]|uniref:lipopolysaccharide biosynthesis protein n=1 Tax=Thiohalorhabdus sp. TaxID=3094134 RepID=UPI003980F6CD
MSDLGGRIATGAAWMLGMRVVVRSIGMISTIIVARLLTPEDFGLVALATSIYALVEFLGAFGFGEAIIQRRDADRSHYDTAWTMNMAFGLLALVALALLAKPMAAFFEEPRLEPIVYVLGLVALVDRAYNPGIEFFKKELQMGKIFRLQVTQKVLAFLVTVSLAVYLRSHWALVLGMALGVATFTAMSFWVSPFRPRPSLARLGDLFGFSAWLFVSSILSYFDRKSGPIVIGKLSGASSIGIYSVSHEIANLPTVEMVKPLNQALFPGYSKVKDEPATLRRYYLKALSLVALLAMPAATGLALLAPLLVPLLLGGQWDRAIPVMQILAVSGMAQALAVVNMSIHLAINQPHLPPIFNAIKVGLLIPALVYAVSRWGVVGAAWAYLGVNFLLVPVRLWVVKRSLSLKLGDLAAVLWRPVGATLVMAMGLQAAGPYLEGVPPGADVAALVAGGGLLYAATVLGLWRTAGSPDGGEEYVLGQFRAWMPAFQR